MADKGVASTGRYYHDTNHLSPTNFDLTLYMWKRPVLGVGRGYTMDMYWGVNPPDVRHIRFRVSGSMSKHSQVFDVHLVLAVDENVLTQTWSSMGMLAKAIQTGLEREYALVCKPIDRTVIDVDYIEKQNQG